MNNDIKNCTTCKNAILCPSWGGYKCLEKKKWIHNANASCDIYIKGTPSGDCHCELCEERGVIESD